MLANPTQPVLPLPLGPEPFPQGLPHHPEDDPFHALEHSLASLSLTTSLDAVPPPFQHPPTLPPSLSENPNPTPNPALTSTSPIPITTALFPPGDNVVFAHSSYFRRNRVLHRDLDLPAPEQVRQQAVAWGATLLPPPKEPGLPGREGERESEGEGGAGAGGGGDHGYAVAMVEDARLLVPFPELGLLVRYGRRVDAGLEGKVMGMVRRALLAAGLRMPVADSSIPRMGGAGAQMEVGQVVPEVFGWRKDGATGDGCLYMNSFGEGRWHRLDLIWAGLSDREKERIAGEVREVVRGWRRLTLAGTARPFVGNVDNGPLQDEIFRGCAGAGMMAPGPFASVSAFHKYFVETAVASSHRRMNQTGPASRWSPHSPQHLLPDDVPIVFTHGGLHPRNIFVSPDPIPHVVAILGWEQAGWYPAYWELCKARLDCARHGGIGDWETLYLSQILDAEDLGWQLRGRWNVNALCQYWGYFVAMMTGRS
ncbi:hypothetical protein VTK26DRAFT_5713 [Humicola hyalothermophila]